MAEQGRERVPVLLRRVECDHGQWNAALGVEGEGVPDVVEVRWIVDEIADQHHVASGHVLLLEQRGCEQEARRDARATGERLRPRRLGPRHPELVVLGRQVAVEKADERPQLARWGAGRECLVGVVGEEHDAKTLVAGREGRQLGLDQVVMRGGDARGDIEGDDADPRRRVEAPTLGARSRRERRDYDRHESSSKPESEQLCAPGGPGEQVDVRERDRLLKSSGAESRAKPAEPISH